MRYHAPHSWLDGQPAAITRKVGSGSFTYIGAWFEEPAMKRAVQWMLTESGLKPDVFSAPNGVEVYRREGSGHDVYILENFSQAQQAVTLPASMKNVLTGRTAHSVTLPVYGVAVLTK